MFKEKLYKFSTQIYLNYKKIGKSLDKNSFRLVKVYKETIPARSKNFKSRKKC